MPEQLRLELVGRLTPRQARGRGGYYWPTEKALQALERRAADLPIPHQDRRRA